MFKNKQNDIIDVVLVSLLLTLNRFNTLPCVSIVDFEQVNTGLELKKQVISKGSPTELQHALKFDTVPHSAILPHIISSQ